MEKEYDLVTAKHYQAYRPPVHNLVLGKAIGADGLFQSGLDIGSGTGQSSIALAAYCENVKGIEPSREMLKVAIPNPGIEYFWYNGAEIPFPDRHFDIVTFAGSLFYAKSQKMLDEVARVSKHMALIVVYDFQVVLEDILEKLNVSKQLKVGGYNHEENFSGLNLHTLRELCRDKDKSHVPVPPSGLAHVLLSQKDVYKALAKKYNTQEPYQMLCNELIGGRADGSFYRLSVNTFYAKYQCIK